MLSGPSAMPPSAWLAALQDLPEVTDDENPRRSGQGGAGAPARHLVAELVQGHVLARAHLVDGAPELPFEPHARPVSVHDDVARFPSKIGRASCRERVCQYV